MINTTVPEVLRTMLASVLGMVGIGAAVSGYLLTRTGPAERALFFVGGLLLIDPRASTDFIGAGMLAFALLLQCLRRQVRVAG